MLSLLITIARKARPSLFWPISMTCSTEDAKRAAQELFVVHQLSMYGSSCTFFSKKVGLLVHYKVTAYALKRERQIGSNSWLVWQGHPSIGSPIGRKEELEFCSHARDFQMFP